MNRKVFIKKLKGYLKNISIEERENIENFYDEMFDDANIKKEDEVPKSFGDPRKIAMEILKDNIESSKSDKFNEKIDFNNINFKDIKDKKDGFFKRISLVFLGLLNIPALFFVVIFLSVILSISLAIGAMFLVIAILTLPFTIWFFPFLIFKIIAGVLAFFILLCIFYFVIKFLYKFFIKDISKNKNKYINRYFKIRFEDEMDEKYEMDENGKTDEKILEFFNIDKLDIDLNSIMVDFYFIDENKIVIDKKNLKNLEIFCKRIDKTLKIKNKIFEDFSYGNNKFILNEKSNLNNKLKIYLPNKINIISHFNASNVKFEQTDFLDSDFTFNASNVKFEDVYSKNLKLEINASNINANLDFEKIDLDVNASNVNLLLEKEKDEIEINYDITMSKVNYFNDKIKGFGKKENTEKKANINLKVALSNVTIN